MRSSSRRLAMTLRDKFKDETGVTYAIGEWLGPADKPDVRGWGVFAEFDLLPAGRVRMLAFHADSKDEAEALVEACERLETNLR